MNSILEPVRKTPVVADVDVAVCGGGPAGFAAAVSAARRGAKTVLIERNGCLGGIWTAGALSWLIDHENKPGIMLDVLERITAMGGRSTRHGKPINGLDVEKMKVLLDELCLEAGVHVRLYTQLANAVVSDDRRVTHVLVESKSGRQAIAAKAFVDCTGDGDIGFYAGCGYDLGHPETGLTQPMSLIALVAGIDPAQVGDYFRSGEGGSWSAPKERLKAEMERGGHSPSYNRPTLAWLRDDLFVLMANHQYGVKGIRAEDLTEATMQARRELDALIDGLRSLGGVWANLRIVATGSQIGVREGRRIHGRATVTSQDLAVGQEHDDAVCRVTMGVDVHGLDPRTCKGIEASPIRAKPYDIPLRALIARDVEGLVMAGRCISGDFIAHSSYRVTGNAVAMGEAAGQVAAVAALTGRVPSEVRRDEIAVASRPSPSGA